MAEELAILRAENEQREDDALDRMLANPERARFRELPPEALEGPEDAPRADPVTEWLCWLSLSHTVRDGGDPVGFGWGAHNAVRVVLGGEDDGGRPRDDDDWRRCVRVLDSAPESVRGPLTALLVQWRDVLLSCLRERAAEARSRGNAWDMKVSAVVDQMIANIEANP
jgi:hypothetical protein